ncbi:polymorphic toxin type 37 domain-containing protein [Nocardia jiangsuensis]|uniref:Polymorphic toxin type 37 domain-containing protein n=1 Tax=Nocardia jiangsuensis TaxID=1691563 RepID=A0ABV8DKA5_9NOCA
MASVAPHTYYTAADACYQLSRELQSAYNPLQTVLLETGGMAGSYPAVLAWSAAYDEHAAAFTLAATGFVNALQHFADILIASGYNWECANYAANRDPNKGIGPACPRTIPSETPYGVSTVTGVASSRNNGPGLESDFPELFDKVTAQIAGGEVPDGDTDKLDRAAKAWKAYVDNDTAFAAESRLRLIADGLQRFDAPDVPNLTEHLRTLSTNAGQIRLAADDLAKSTASHHTALVAMRAEISTQIAATLVVASVVIAVALVAIRNPRALAAEGIAIDVTATAIVRIAGTFFATLGGISFGTGALTTGALATITGLTILSIAGDATFNANRKPPGDAYDPDGAKAPGKPGDAEGFVPPKGGEQWVPSPNGRGFGWLDADGKVWVPTGKGATAHGGPHWDVQDGKSYDNVYPGGKRR